MVCFEVDIDHEIINPGILCNWSSKYVSIIDYKKARFITNTEKTQEDLNITIGHYSPGASYNFHKKSLREAAMIKIEIKKITEKKIKIKKIPII
jgi:nitroimidazol reductase NimA-like FMN-containing flavoprotein (pyridoxamine 5'-phosphate oxidase superfamily)